MKRQKEAIQTPSRDDFTAGYYKSQGGVLVPGSEQELIQNPEILDYAALAPEEFLASPRLFIETFLSIIDNDGVIRPFIFNKVQLDYYNYLIDTYYKPFKRPDGVWVFRFQGIRDIHLKHRQYGLSTLICGIFYYDTLFNPGTETAIYCQDGRKSAQMLSKWRIFIEESPADYRPILEYNNANLIKLAVTNSKVAAYTPGSTEAIARKQGRSTTIRNAHCSEFSDWAVPQVTYNSLQKAVPPTGNFIIEASPRRQGDYYHVMWEGARTGRNVFRPYLTPWFDNPENILAVTKTQAAEIIKTLGREERELVLKHKLNVQQIAWRRNEILRVNGDMLEFYKENPENDVDCFAVAGTLLFPRHMHKITCQPRPAMKGRMHAIGVDVAMGTGDGDNSAIEVIDVISLENIFSMSMNNIPPDLLAYIVYEVFLMYPGMVVIESNSIGQATLSTAYNLDWADPECNFLFHNSSSHGGYYTTGSNKTRGILKLRTDINEKLRGNEGLAISSAQVVREMAFFQRLKRSTASNIVVMGSPSGKAPDGGQLTDDNINALRVAYDALDQIPDFTEAFMARFGPDYQYIAGSTGLGDFKSDPLGWVQKKGIPLSAGEAQGILRGDFSQSYEDEPEE